MVWMETWLGILLLVVNMWMGTGCVSIFWIGEKLIRP
jgi:hypothetical protein